MQIPLKGKHPAASSSAGIAPTIVGGSPPQTISGE